MALVKRFTLAAMILILAAPVVLAGPNAGGLLVVHDPGLAYTLDTPTYVGLSVVACGQDGPVFPAVQECPPYDPIGGANPCDPRATNPTSIMPAGEPHVWYVMAAFPPTSCPRLKTLGFRVAYDSLKVVIRANGVSAPSDVVSLTISVPSSEDGRPFPRNRSGVAVTYLETRTSLLQEIWWFAGYAYAGATDATFAVQALEGSEFFNDDSVPAVLDDITGFGTLGLGGTTGFSPDFPVPVEPTSWGRIKAIYGKK